MRHQFQLIGQGCVATHPFDAYRQLIGQADKLSRSVSGVELTLCLVMDTAVELLKLGVVGLIAGLFSSVVANRDHRHRKWWELRVSAYQNAIEALPDIVYYYEKHYSAEIQYRELPEDFKKKLDTYWEESFPKVRKFADSGAFLFSERANSALRELIRDDDEPTYIDHLDNNLQKQSGA